MKMHETPDVPGTSPVTDNPNPGGTQGADTTGPSTGPGPRPEDIATGPTSGTEGSGQTGHEREVLGRAPAAGMKSFRCADVGFADCKWEARARNEAELMPQIERHGREHHDVRRMDEGILARIKRAIRERAA